MNNATPLKENELRQLAKCAHCEKLLGQTGSPMFFRVEIACHIIKADAIQRQTGLTHFLGGSARLAQAMGPNEDMTTTIQPAVTVMICHPCSFGELMLAPIFYRVNEAAQSTTPAP